jgi:hypothetical protein
MQTGRLQIEALLIRDKSPRSFHATEHFVHFAIIISVLTVYEI